MIEKGLQYVIIKIATWKLMYASKSKLLYNISLKQMLNVFYQSLLKYCFNQMFPNIETV